MWPNYAETYVAGISELRDKAIEIFGDTIIDKAVNVPSLTIYALSPYRLIAKISDEGIKKVPEVVDAYISEYTKLWEKSECLTMVQISNIIPRKRLPPGHS